MKKHCLSLLTTCIIFTFMFSNIILAQDYSTDVPSDIYENILPDTSQSLEPLILFNEIEPLAGAFDITPPILVDINVDKELVEAPGVFTVSAIITDDLSGVSSAYVSFINKQNNKIFSVLLSNSYWDGDAYQVVQLDSNTYIGFININEYEVEGVLEIYNISITDKILNSQYYKSEPNQWELEQGYLPIPKNISITIVNNNQSDITPPMLLDIVTDKTIINVPDSFTITATITDDLSDIISPHITFKDTTSNKTFSTSLSDRYWDEDTHQQIQLPNNTYMGTISIKEYESSGAIQLYRVGLTDTSSNYQYYVKNPSEQELAAGYLPLQQDILIQINNDGQNDITPPALEELTVDKYIIETPAIIKVSARIIDDLSGVNYGFVSFKNTTNNKMFSTALSDTYYDEVDNTTKNLPINTYVGNISIGEYEPPGILQLESITIYDNANNYQYYVKNPNEGQLEQGYLLLPVDISIEIINEESFDFATNTNNPNLVEDIINQPDDALIGINYETGSEINSIVFDSIKDTNKTLVFQGDGIEWEFNGHDIVESKNIDLNVSISQVQNFYGNDFANIKDIVRDTPSLVLSFADNGQLPGKAIIRVKVDYAFRSYLGTQDLYVYYYDKLNNTFVPIATSINITEFDEYIEFEIDHNSNFLITKGEIVPKPIDIQPKNIEIYLGKPYIKVDGNVMDIYFSPLVKGNNIIYLSIRSVADILNIVFELDTQPELRVPPTAIIFVNGNDRLEIPLSNNNANYYLTPIISNGVIMIAIKDIADYFNIPINLTIIKATNPPDNNNYPYDNYYYNNYNNTNYENSNNSTNPTNTTEISTSTNTVSWSNIQNQIASAKDGDTITVDMKGETKIPTSIINALKDKNITLVLIMDSYSWSINGKTVTNVPADITSYDLKVTKITDTSISALSNRNDNAILELAHNGVFPFSATLKWNVGTSYRGKQIYLNYYNESLNRLELRSKATVDNSGNVNFVFDRASKYVLTDLIVKDTYIKDNPNSGMLRSKSTTTSELTSYVPYLIANSKATQVKFSGVINGDVIFKAPLNGHYEFRNNKKSFNDISGHWAESTIDFITSRELFSGIGNDKFNPNGEMTRAMFATVLSRLDGADLSNYNNILSFKDVDIDTWYGAPIAWAVDNGLIAGFAGNLFKPNDLITREQMAVMLDNYIKYKGIVLQERTYTEFADDEAISSWAKEAVANMKRYGLSTGVGNNSYAPKDTATRASVAQIFMNFINAYVK